MSIGTSNFSQVHPSLSSSIASSTTRQINHAVEISADLSPTTSVQSLTVPPSSNSVIVESRVVVQTAGARGLRSPQYVASQRRNRTTKIRARIRELSAYSSRQDFTSYTFPIVDDLRKAISYLDEFQELEGNSTAILRQVRNTFFDGGWLLYKSSVARDAVDAVLTTLLVDQPIEPEAAKNGFRMLLEAGLKPFLPGPLDDLDEETDGGDD